MEGAGLRRPRRQRAGSSGPRRPSSLTLARAPLLAGSLPPPQAPAQPASTSTPAPRALGQPGSRGGPSASTSSSAPTAPSTSPTPTPIAVGAVSSEGLSWRRQLTKTCLDYIQKMAPSTNWVGVMKYIDHAGFNIMMLLGRWRQLSMRRRRRGSSGAATGCGYSSWVVIDFFWQIFKLG